MNGVYGDLHLSSSKPYIYTESGHEIAINTNTVGQYTGLLDKSGNEIYEGDILTYNGIRPHRIEWNRKTTAFWAVSIESGVYSDVRSLVMLDYKVTGTEYDRS